MGPARTAARLGKEALTNPLNPAASWYGNRATAAAFDMFIDATRRYSKPEWNLKSLEIDGEEISVTPETVLCHPFPYELATSRPLSWFKNTVVKTVPWPNLGFLRRVYPGFLQLSGFMSMNLDRHMDAHARQFGHLIKGDGDNSDAHRKFYDEYLAVMDLTAEFYIQTIDRVFQRRLLAVGDYMYRDHLVDPSHVKDIAFFTIEGEKDDITGLEQTEAAHTLLSGLPKSKKQHYVAPKVGHYGVFNGSRWRENIQPRVQKFIAKHRSKPD